MHWPLENEPMKAKIQPDKSHFQCVNWNGWQDLTNPALGADYLSRKVLVNDESVSLGMWDTAGSERNEVNKREVFWKNFNQSTHLEYLKTILQKCQSCNCLFWNQQGIFMLFHVGTGLGACSNFALRDVLFEYHQKWYSS